MTRCFHMVLVLVFALCQAGEPAPDFSLTGFVNPAVNEHPRLFFRAADLPKLKERAATTEGKRIIARLRFLLDGGNGTSLPAKRNPLEAGDDPGDLRPAPYGSVFTLFHSVGYGMLWRLTGDKAAGDLASESAILVAKGQSDRDARFGLNAPAGGEYSGAAVAALAIAYDLCHDVWSDATKQIVIDALTTDRLGKTSSSASCLAYLAFLGDTLAGKPIRIVARDPLPFVGGEYARMPPFGIGGRDSDMRFALFDVTQPLAIQAMRVAGGIDLAKGYPAMVGLVDRLLWLVMPGRCGVQIALPFEHAPMSSMHLDRTGLAGGGQFVQAMGMASPDRRAALRWVYEHFCVPTLGRDFPASGVKDGENDFDTVGPYPHRALLALINWPFDEAPRNPAEVLPPQATNPNGDASFFVVRNAWSGPDDVLVAFQLARVEGRDLATPRDAKKRCQLWAYGQRYLFDLPSHVTQVGMRQRGEGSWLLFFGKNYSVPRILIDFNSAGGLDAVVISHGLNIIGDFSDAGRPDHFDLTGDWSCSRELVVHVDQADKQFTVAADNPWGRGKPVVGTINGEWVSLTRANGLIRGRMAPHGHVITWDDGAVWRRKNSLLELPQLIKVIEVSHTQVRGTTVFGKDVRVADQSSNLSVLTCSPTGQHSELKSIKGGVTIGERTFLFPEPETPKPPAVKGEAAKPSTAKP
ncbi:hypothetical protein LBMAG53_20130 [Planctomycetota bacterium]|nr:hypothetical protein LBMAG53_20130 [Planctomycetota bacterium]